MDASKVNVVIIPLDYKGTPGVSHSGLAISAINTAKVLRTEGVNAVVRPCRNVKEVPTVITSDVTHVVINAFWMPVVDLAKLVQEHSDVVFCVICHSNIAFLQVEPGGIKMLRDYIDLEAGSLGNFCVAGNSRGFVESIQRAYEAPATYLPNLYYLDDHAHARAHRPNWNGGTLRIGAYGAMRPLKNPTASAFAALQIATELSTDLEFHVNIGRNDGWGDRTLQAVRAILRDLPNVTLVEDGWTDWTTFRRSVRAMHLLLQPSFTESFNIVTADGVAMGIASVVSDVIEWAPDYWKASPDNVNNIARVGRSLLSDHYAGQEGLDALTRHNEDGIRRWTEYLTR